MQLKGIGHAILFLVLLPSHLIGQWHSAVYVGKTFNHDSDIRLFQSPGTNVRFIDVAFSDESFSTPVYYGIRAGYMLSPGFGIEGEFVHAKVLAHLDTPVPARGILRGAPADSVIAPNQVFQGYSVSHGLNFLLVNVVHGQDLTDRLDLVLRGGMGAAIPHPEISVLNRTLHEYQLGGPALHLAAGLEFVLKDRWSVLGEYKFTATRGRFVLPASIEVESTFLTHHFVTGMKVRF